VDFWAPWCGPCRIVGPIVEELAVEYAGKPIKIGKLNVDENNAIAMQFGIMSIPTLIIFKNGAPAAQLVGAQSKDKLKEAIEKALAA
jgi:thioredoxin 1